MKRWIALMLAVLMVWTMVACGKSSDPGSAEQTKSQPAVKQPTESSEPAQPEEPERPELNREPEMPVLSGAYTAYDGTYRLQEQKMEGEDTYVTVRSFPEFLLIEYFTEYEGSVYSFWVEEFWPDEGVVLGESGVLSGRSQNFSLMSVGNIYSAMPVRRSFALTPDGITLQTEGLEEEVYLRVEACGYHTAQAELLDRLHDMISAREAPDLVGNWELWDGWRTIRVNLQADGGFHFISKEPGMPVWVMDGVWGVDADTGDIQIVAELAGDGNYPYHAIWQWQLDDNGYLYLRDAYGNILPQVENDMCFWRTGDEIHLNMTQLTAMGYVWNSYDLSGEYTDQYDTEYYYSYRLPLFLEDEGELAEINDEIEKKFAPIIEDELTAMEANEFLTTENVDWNLYVTEDIVTLYIHTFSYMVEYHQTYYYDLRTNSRTDSRELIRRIGMDESAFLEAVRNAAEDYFIEAFSGLAEEDREEYGYYDFLEWTVSDEAVNFDLPIFVDAIGNLCVMGRIGSMAGASEFWAPLYPFAEFHGFDNAVG